MTRCYLSSRSVRRLFPFIAVILVYAFVPGMCEFAETLAHLATTGDLHTSDHERHAEHGESSGQDGEECHTCICHAPTAFLMGPVVAPSGPVSVVEAATSAPDEAIDGDALRELFRPPIV